MEPCDLPLYQVFTTPLLFPASAQEEQAEYEAKERAEFEDPVADLKVLISADPATANALDVAFLRGLRAGFPSRP